MEEFKLEEIEQIYHKSLKYRTITKEEREIINSLFPISSCKEKGTVDYIENNSIQIKDYNALSKDFDFTKLYSENGFKFEEDIAISFDDLQSIDIINGSDLCKYFNFLWYPIAEDMIIINLSFTKVLLLTHYGVVLVYDIIK
ncbi:MAG: hypothetical protein IJK49_07160 [Prevotella sp.]|jgi:hypothetical protein|nr:hypothetical protein [Prevotella sp.]